MGIIYLFRVDRTLILSTGNDIMITLSISETNNKLLLFKYEPHNYLESIIKSSYFVIGIPKITTKRNI